ncbi:DciA family protein [Streptomyces sp. DH12]|uniref:DciA family protein n=1 Tax=Streptomyces sp. DH12 TaxID=2857010 RepID=UPI001E2EE491|nr:DciA family protein [Streptomyces sp. DH12]
MAIAPDLAGHVAAVGYEPDAGRPTVCAETSAWATKVRLEQARIIAAANESAGRTFVPSAHPGALLRARVGVDRRRPGSRGRAPSGRCAPRPRSCTTRPGRTP